MATWCRQPTGDGISLVEKDNTAVVVWVAADHLTPAEALADPDFPIARNDYHPDYGSASLMRCRDVRINATGFRVMTVTANFAIPRNGSFEVEPSLSKPRVFNWQTVQETVQVDRDKDGNAILTSARRALPGITQVRNAKRLIVTNWESTYAAGTALSWENSVNEDAFEGAAPTEVKLESVTPSTSYENGTTLLPIDYAFLFKPTAIWGQHPHQTWVLDRDSQGFFTIDGVVQRRRLVDKDSSYLSDILMDGHGRPKDTTELVTYINRSGVPEPSPSYADKGVPTGAEAINVGLATFLVYHTYPSRNFSELGFI